ncbi:alpha/beta fold hydrolase [Shimia marina]|uniref:Arylesterase n=1 Tax=Shimia marina TaxID=321267 RepID=A0A0P1EPQ9_9RHOB|nr:alpha/beta fold hydrolase [Shimia marina]CUH52329.1 Arylesterase [Shimia marina]SFE08886.1 Pimeloyl-ACP methyl ester carboxylesterase [Shimia marina]
MQIAANSIQIEVETFGPKDGVPLVLIRGLGSQLIHWPDALYEGLAELGYHVVIFDNRDVGRSQRCPKEGVPSGAEEITARALEDGKVPPAYRLDDMAKDVVGVMDALDIEKAHVFGMSMGGAIVQLLCLDHAERLLSATIVMATARPFAERAGSAAWLAALLARPVDRATFINNAVTEYAGWGSPAYPMTEAELRAQATQAYDRAFDPEGVNRQVLAVMASTDRREDLRHVALPCQVIHGEMDTLIPPEAGAEIAALIPGCAHHPIAGMGHVITPKQAPMLVEMMQAFVGKLAV